MIATPTTAGPDGRTVLDIAGRRIGGEHFAIIAGPCETAYRCTLDLAAVPLLKERTGLPVIVDPSHAAGRREIVEPLSLAAAAVGADGVLVEVHLSPEEAACDGRQSLVAAEFAGYAARVRAAARLAGKTIADDSLAAKPIAENGLKVAA